jgi:Protein of unknown function (DUF1778)
MTDTRDDTEKAEDSASAQIIRLSVEDQRALAEAILNPPPPSPALLRAFATHRKLIEESRSREVLGIEDFTEADSEAIQRTQPSPESAAFNHELTEDP